MPKKHNITQTELKEYIHYDPLTGKLTWIKKSANWINVGDEAGTTNNKGYRAIGLKRKVYGAHRLVYLYVTGAFPKHEVDHINHIRDDNRWCNLRLANSQINSRNRKLNENNKSGVSGVHWHKRDSKWYTEIRINGESNYLGTYKSLEEAAKVRKAAELKYGFHENHGAETLRISINNRNKKGGTPLADRFNAKVSRAGEDECWEWTALKDSHGYGIIRGGSTNNQKWMQAHRVAWELSNGPIPRNSGRSGAYVFHRCGNRGCVNSNHLFMAGNAAEHWSKKRDS